MVGCYRLVSDQYLVIFQDSSLVIATFPAPLEWLLSSLGSSIGYTHTIPLCICYLPLSRPQSMLVEEVVLL